MDSGMSTSAEPTTHPAKRKHTRPGILRQKVSSVTSGPGESSRSRGQTNDPARGLPAGQYIAVHYIRSGRSGAPDVHALGMFSVTHKRNWYDLPPIPFDGGIRSGCQCISLARKIFVLGGVMEGHVASGEVFVYDPMTNEWARCASMLHPRMNFGVGVLHGQIYAFGGRNRRKSVVECERYDPQINSWLKVCVILDARVNPRVAAAGESLTVFGGIVLDADYLNPQFRRTLGRDSETWVNSIFDGAGRNEPGGDSDDVFPSTVMFYHPIQNRWTWMRTDKGQHWSDSVFLAQGVFHRLTNAGIFVHTKDFGCGELSWSLLHSFQDADELPFWLMLHKLSCRTLLRAGELWIVSSPSSEGIACLLRTKGYGSRNPKIELKMALCLSGKFDEGSTIIFPVDL